MLMKRFVITFGTQIKVFTNLAMISIPLDRFYITQITMIPLMNNGLILLALTSRVKKVAICQWCVSIIWSGYGCDCRRYGVLDWCLTVEVVAIWTVVIANATVLLLLLLLFSQVCDFLVNEILRELDHGMWTHNVSITSTYFAFSLFLDLVKTSKTWKLIIGIDFPYTFDLLKYILWELKQLILHFCYQILSIHFYLLFIIIWNYKLQ